MTRIFLFSSFLLALMSGCGKDEPVQTTIRGIVTDRKTGEPIEGARVTLGFVTENSVHGSLQSSTDYAYLSTDAKGQFSHTQGDYGYLNGGSSVEKDGYVPNLNLLIEKGKENMLDITMLPEDAIFKITLVNQTGQQMPLYFLIMSPLVNKEGHGMQAFIHLNKNNPLTLPQDGKYTKVFSLPEDKIQIYWDFFNFYATPNKAMWHDNIQLIANDTVKHTIIY